MGSSATWRRGDPRARAAAKKGAAKSARTRRLKAVQRALDACEPLLPANLPPHTKERVLKVMMRCWELGAKTAWQSAWVKYSKRQQTPSAA